MAGRLIAIAVAVTTGALLLAASGSPRSTKEGGTFRIAVAIGVNTIDPGLVSSPPEFRLLDPACSSLMAFPDKPLPAGFRVAPDLAEAEPVVSRDGRTYTFTIRKDARFSTDAPVTAMAFKHALERIFTPAMQSASAGAFEDIVGARKMLAGKETTLAGVVANGRTLTLRLTKRIPDLLARTAGLCAVPANLPADPEGTKAPLPSAAPYYVSEYVPGERLVMERNRFYRGRRPHHVDRFVADLTANLGSGFDQVASGTADTLIPGPTAEQAIELARRYGVNKSQFFIMPGNTLRVFVINTSRPLFRNNVKLRQAVNFAVDRKALVREYGPQGGVTPTDQYLLPNVPGYRDERIYPLKGPDLRRARALAKGHLRGGKAVLYTLDNPFDVARAQILQRNLQAIGLDLEIKAFPITLYFSKVLRTPGEPFDLARLDITDLTDPVYLNVIFDKQLVLFDNVPPKYKRLLDRASRLTGEGRYRAYGDLDVQISRDVAPMIPVEVLSADTFVSARVGCIVLNPLLDLTPVCLK